MDGEPYVATFKGELSEEESAYKVESGDITKQQSILLYESK